MAITTPTSPPVITATHGQAAAMGTSHGLTEPVRGAANHVLGQVQTGLIHSGEWPTGAEGTGRVWTYRHPNATHLACWVYLSAPTERHSTFTVQAGAGAAQTRTCVARGGFWLSVPWAVADAGWNLVTYTATDCDIIAIEIWGLTRSRLDPATELASDIVDPGHAMAGLGPGEYIVHDSHGYNVDGLALAVRNAAKFNLRHAVTWCAVEGSLSVTPGAGVAGDPFDFSFSHQARHLKSGDTYRRYRVQARTWQVGAGTYTWSVTSSFGTITTAALAGGVGTEDEASMTTLQIDCTADDVLTFELTPSAGQTLHVSDLSIVEYEDGVMPAVPAVLFAYYGDSTGDPASADRLGWPVDDLVASLVFDWADGDSTAPDTGPSPLTKNGTVTAGQPTPWLDLAGNPVTCSEFLDNSNYHQATSIDPAAGHDVVGLVLCRRMDTATGAVFSTMANAAAAGISLSTNGTTLTLTVRNSVLATTTLTATIAIRAWHLFGFTVDADGNTKLYTCGVLADTDASPGGTLGAASGFSINAHYVSQDDFADVVRAMWWTGAGIAATATDAWHAAVAEAVLGIRPSVGTTGSTYARTTTGVYYPTGDPDTRVHILGAGCPPAGNVEGLGSDENIVSQGSKNYALDTGDEAGATTYDHLTGGEVISFKIILPSVVSDAAALAAAGAREIGPNALKLLVDTAGESASGAADYPTATLPGAAIGSTATCWASIRAREVAGTWEMGWYDSATDTWTAIVAISGPYTRVSGTSAPSHTTCKLAVRCTSEVDDDQLNCVFWCCGVGSRIPDEVPSQEAAGSATTKAQGVLTTAHDPSDTAGTIDLEQTPRLHGGSASPTTTLLTAGDTAIIAHDASGYIGVVDGTNEADADVTEADGTSRTARAAWEGTDLYAAVVGGDDGTDSYDGAWPAGVLKIPGTCRATQALRVYDLAEETTDPLP